jgi:hypothetical protein
MSHAAGEVVASEGASAECFSAIRQQGNHEPVGIEPHGTYSVTIEPGQIGVVTWVIQLAYGEGEWDQDAPTFSPVGDAGPCTFRHVAYYGSGIGWLTGSGTYLMSYGLGMEQWDSRLTAVSVIVCALGAALYP